MPDQFGGVGVCFLCTAAKSDVMESRTPARRTRAKPRGAEIARDQGGLRMIVRKLPDGRLMLIGQTDHSRLVGQLGAHWGNERFAAPEPYDSVARAAAYHDYGWLRYETAPQLVAESGETPEFRQVPSSPEQLAAYQWCIDWLSAIDPYAGLIVGMHRTGLWRARYETIKHPENSTRKLSPAIEDFVAANEARQERERKAFDAAQLWTNYRLLQVWDLLGLYFCCADPVEDYIEPVPLAYGGGKSDGVQLRLTPRDKRTVGFDPFPFNHRPCSVQLSYRLLPAQIYPDLDSFRRAYFQAPVDLMNFELI
jgi:Protein of unknown function (DUF3891)